MRLAALAGAIALATPAFAQTDTPKRLSEEWTEAPRIENECETTDLRYAGAPLMRVHSPGARPVPLFKEKKSCIRGSTCPWVGRAALAPGAVVLVGPADKGFHCAYYAAPNGRLAAGFVPAESLRPVEQEEKSLPWQFLAGTWRDGDMRIVMGHTRGGLLRIRATGTYRGTGSVNEGGFAADIPLPKGGESLILRDENCIVALERRGPFLLVNDNARCGGHNVRFVGIYTKAAAR